MKYPKYENEIDALLESGKTLTVKDFLQVFGNMPMPSVYARIRHLVEGGRLSVVGKGQYLAAAKPDYSIPVTEWMKSCNAVMITELEGVDACISERNGNLEVEVGKMDMARTLAVLRQHFSKVMYRKDVSHLLEEPRGFVLVGRMVSESPFFFQEGVAVPALEKEIVDVISRGEENPLDFQRKMEVYPVNRNRLQRYASRRGVQEELELFLRQIDHQRVQMFSLIQRYMLHTQIVRAWVFGSFARGEENESSDLDLLVDYDMSKGLSLFDIIRYQLDMEKLIGRQVDLVQNGCLKPFAQASAERDKYLIYERKGQ